MSHGHPWQVRGIDPELRDAAVLAANRSGMTLGQWLNSVIAETAAEAPRYASRPDYDDEPPTPPAPGLRRARLKQRPSPQTLSARAYQADDSYDRVNDIVESAIARIERASRDTHSRAADWMDRAATAAEQAALVHPAPASASEPGHNSKAQANTILSDSLRAIAIRLDGLDRRLTGQEPPALASPEPQARPVMPVRLHPPADGALKAAGPRPAPPADIHGDRVARLEAKLGAILQTMSRQRHDTGVADGGIGKSSEAFHGAGMQTALSEIAARQAKLNGGGTSLASRRAVAARQEPDAIASLKAEIEDLSGGIDTMIRRAEGSQGMPLSAELAKLHSAIDSLAPRQVVQNIDTAIRELSQKVDGARSTGGRTAQLEPLERLVGDLHAAVQSLRDPGILDGLRVDLTQLGKRIDAIGAQPQQNESFRGLRDEIAGIRTMIGAAQQPSALEGLHREINQLGSKLDRIIERPSDVTAVLGLSSAVKDVRQALDRAHPQDVLAKVEERIHSLGDFEKRMTALAGQLERNAPPPGGGDALSDIRARLDRLQTVLETAPGNADLSGFESAIRQMAQRLERLDQSWPGDALPDIRKRLDSMQASLAAAPELVNSGNLEPALRQLAAKLEGLGSGGNAAGLEDIRRKLDAVHQAVSNSQASAHPGDPDLARSLQLITAKLDRLSQGGAASSAGALDPRIDTLLQAHHDGDTPRRLTAIEASFSALAAQLASIHGIAPDTAVLAGIQDKITRLTDRIESADGSNRSLDAIEAALRGLVQQAEAIRRAAVDASEAAARASQHAHASGPGVDIDFIREDLESLRSAQSASTSRMESSLGTMHGTLEKLVERLAQSELAAARQLQAAPAGAMAAMPPAARSAPAVDALPPLEPAALRAVSQPKPAPPPQPALASAKADPPAPVDTLIEPGNGRPGLMATRRAAAAPLDSDSGASKANFIAAARRAAQAAMAQQNLPADKTALPGGLRAGSVGGALQTVQAFYASRKKPILLGLAAVFAGLIALQVAGSILRTAGSLPPAGIEDVKKSSAPAPVPQASAPAKSEPAAGEKRSAIEPARPTLPAIAAQPKADPLPTGSIAAAAPIPAAPAVPPLAAASPLPAAPSLAAPVITPPAPASPPTAGIPADLAALAKPVKAERLQLAASQGDASALFEIGSRYADGRTLPRDAKAAAQFFEAAAKQGHAPSQYRLASLHREARIPAPDKQRAFELFQQAAEVGHMRAMHNMGVMLAEGALAAPDYAAAAEWFGRAAEHNVRDSQYNLGILYARGLGVTQDLTASYRWFHAAAEQGDEDGRKKRDEVAARIPAEKLVEVKAAAQRWRPSLPDPKVNEASAPAGGWDAPAKPAAAKPRAAGRI